MKILKITPPILIKYIYFCPQKFNVYNQVKANDAIRPLVFAPFLPYDEFSNPKFLYYDEAFLITYAPPLLLGIGIGVGSRASLG